MTASRLFVRTTSVKIAAGFMPAQTFLCAYMETSSIECGVLDAKE